MIAMWAIFSCVHANLEALTAVLADIDRHPVDRIFCLGDMVGYGPNPVECIDLIRRRCQVAILGNHDQGAMFDPDGWGATAEKAIFWTRSQLEESPGSRGEREARWNFLAECPRAHREGGLLFVHGSARNPLNEYVFPEDIYIPRKMERIFSLVERCCFQGHTHVPGVFVEQTAAQGKTVDVCTGEPAPGQAARPDADASYLFLAPEEGADGFRLDHRKAMVNVGSVGQPRDGDPRACYVLYDAGTVRFRRVPYAIDTTVDKIYAVTDLENFLGDRLRDGR
jgi:diadenosine tetraphosphatase ApaH/serine/threonine PP2A family protein phosphatase